MDHRLFFVLLVLCSSVLSTEGALCQRFCPYGFVLDDNGQPTCDCAQKTVIHEGVCPNSTAGTVGACVEMCAHDGDCLNEQKCCSNHCGHVCANSEFPEKSGECPSPSGLEGVCVAECQYDLQCPGIKKCCSNGCGQICTSPVGMTGPISDVRPGSCPTGELAQGMMGVCAELCKADTECPTHHKCCSNGCGHVCMQAEDLPVVHAGSCPMRSGEIGICAEMCDNDGDCNVDEKCCSSGCGHVCHSVAQDIVTCPDVMCFLYCEHGYKQDKGCDTCECNAETEIHAGECPLIPDEQVGICISTCDHDGGCPANQKCCSNGCGRTCVEAVSAAEIKDGVCPLIDTMPDNTWGICSDLCTSDQDCNGTAKCCSNGCGHVCVAPDTVSPHSGLSCPIGTLPLGASGICSEMCSRDSECGQTQKCCSNGCGHVCVDSSDIHPLCSENVACHQFCPYGHQLDDYGCPTCLCNTPAGVHPGTCPTEILPDGVLAICANLCENDDDCADTQKCCSNGCGHICVDMAEPTDAASCPEMMCLIWCEHGYKTDQNGCDTCECNQEPASCAAVMCNRFCLYGNQIDKRGCPICACRDKQDFCTEVTLSSTDCPNGFARSSSGCPTTCVPIEREIRPGICPSVVVSDEEVGTCANHCDNDNQCLTNTKCCFNGCGYSCVPDGVHHCPDVMCMQYCPHGFKRDRDGCSICECNTQSVIHEGACPVIEDGMSGICVEMCHHDGNCSANEKCCSNGCGHACIEAVQSVAQSGECPIGLLPEGVSGVCLEACQRDSDCYTNQRCCSNGCGHTCVTMTYEPAGTGTCPDMMCQMFCEYGFAQDENGCNMCVCNDQLVVHPGTCPVGALLEGVLGICAELCANDRSCAANQKCCSNGCGHECIDVAPDCSDRVTCMMFCEHGYVKDGDDCDTCQCVEPGSCPEVMCLIFCEHGTVRDENGCNTCLCNPAPVTCPPIMCNMFCEHGFSTDKQGCDICQCNPAPVCQEVMCDMYCPSGFLLNEHGCQICTCYEPPVVHPGSCPMSLGGMGVCVQDCADDGDCSTNQKCCSNGCGHVCMEAELESPKTGVCPAMRDDVVGVCAELCRSDSQCAGEQKCCSNGCGLSCMDPDPMPKPGTCPSASSKDNFGICVNECEDDHSCTADYKCCHNGCGMTCVSPELVTKPGKCPAVSPKTMGLCVEDCRGDEGCPNNFKCCSNGCGHVCIDPTHAAGDLDTRSHGRIISPLPALIILLTALALSLAQG